MAEATLRLLLDPVLLTKTRRFAYEYAKPMFWPNVGRKYLTVFEQALGQIEKRRTPDLQVYNPPMDAISADRLHKEV